LGISNDRLIALVADCCKRGEGMYRYAVVDEKNIIK
jgi:hypothetical protein